ncbi:hypothetical protein FRC09_013352 [Ceratobasidium sp. 395]|nr:hypothetical protein FRC09_013352 [Ceratobasidium sp. 395]
MSSGIDVEVARNMVGGAFTKRAKAGGLGLKVEAEVGGEGDYEEIEGYKSEEEGDRTLRGVRSWVSEDGTLGSDRTFTGYKILDGGTPFEINETPWDEEGKEERQKSIEVATGTPERQQTRGDDLSLGSQSSGRPVFSAHRLEYRFS